MRSEAAESGETDLEAQAFGGGGGDVVIDDGEVFLVFEPGEEFGELGVGELVEEGIGALLPLESFELFLFELSGEFRGGGRALGWREDGR